MTQIYCFGDSLTFGAWDIEGGWTQRLRKFLDGKNILDTTKPTLLYNLGVSGNTVEDLLERFEFEAKERMKDNLQEEHILIFQIGGNDSSFIKSKNDLWVSQGKFKEGIEKLIELAQRTSSKIIFLGLIPFDDPKTNPSIFNPDLYYKTENGRKYDEILKSVCLEKKVYFVEIFSEFEKFGHKDLLEDGIHPNSAGHQKIYEIVKNFLFENKII